MTGELAALITSVLGIMLTAVTIIVLKDVEGNSTSKFGNVFHNTLLTMAIVVWGVLNIYTLLHGPAFLNDISETIVLPIAITKFVCVVVIVASVFARKWRARQTPS